MTQHTPRLLISDTQFSDALGAASALTDLELRVAAGSGQSRSYFVRHNGRNLPLKAILRLAYRNSGLSWNGVQSASAANDLAARFEILHQLSKRGEADEDISLASDQESSPGRVYIANFGEANTLWQLAKANNTIVTVDNLSVHPFWQNGDRDGFITTAMETTFTARGERPTRSTASRWFNLIDELRASEGDLWISRQGESLWWSISQPGKLREAITPSTNPKRDGPNVWLLEKPCLPWSDRDREGRPLQWAALHAKARDFLATEATFQTIGNDRGYANYAKALISGYDLTPWHSQPLFKAKAALAKSQAGRIFSPKELAAARMTATMLATVSQANGQSVDRRVKEKLTSLSRAECEKLLLEKMAEQDDRCALTGLPLGLDNECNDREMLASLDRIDSSGHYTADNVQIVCRFVNRWKGADDDALVRRLLTAVQG